MAYNRMSHGGNQQHHGRGRKKEDENDALMRLVSQFQPVTGVRLVCLSMAAC